MELWLAALLFGAGFLAGVTNAVAGGGTFFTFPVMLGAGLPPVIANASNAFAVWPASVLAAIGYRRELRPVAHKLIPSGLVALLGAVLGAWLLIWLGDDAFTRAIPWLLGFGTALFAFGPRIYALTRRWQEGRRRDQATGMVQSPPVRGRQGFGRHKGLLLELPFAVYGGYFGAGIGVMLMASLSMMGIRDIQQNNALKNYLSGLIVSVAVVVFIGAGLISWPHALIACAGAALGGTLGARLARALPERLLRNVVLTVGTGLTLYYAWDIYGR
jgi:uncharacterized protein